MMPSSVASMTSLSVWFVMDGGEGFSGGTMDEEIWRVSF
jgi:hypothetical protein